MPYKDILKKQEYQKSWYENNKERISLENKERRKQDDSLREPCTCCGLNKKAPGLGSKWCNDCRIKFPGRASWSRRWNELNEEYKKQYDRERRLTTKYNLTTSQWKQLFINQGSCCAICETDKPESRNGWHTDHDHKTGKVRGILCHHCNSLLGYSKENLYTLEEAIRYLKENDSISTND